VRPRRKHVFQKLLQRAIKQSRGRQPGGARGGLYLDETLENLRSIVLDDDDERKYKLASVLKARRLRLRADSSFCNSFITGNTDASIGEVVATMRITAYLFRLGHAYWSQNATYLEGHMRRKALALGNWDAAVDATLANRGLISEPYENNYKDRDRYCWTCGGDFPCYRCGRF